MWIIRSIYLLLSGLLVFTIKESDAVSCNRDLGGGSLPRIQGDNGYRVRITGQPEFYNPGDTYQGNKNIEIDLNSFHVLTLK